MPAVSVYNGQNVGKATFVTTGNNLDTEYQDKLVKASFNNNQNPDGLVFTIVNDPTVGLQIPQNRYELQEMLKLSAKEKLEKLITSDISSEEGG